MIAPRFCPDCGGLLSRGTIHGTAEAPIPCVICWACGWQTPAVYQRSRHQRNVYAGSSAGNCQECGAQLTAAKPMLLRALCDDCYAARRSAPTMRRVS